MGSEREKGRPSHGPRRKVEASAKSSAWHLDRGERKKGRVAEGDLMKRGRQAGILTGRIRAMAKRRQQYRLKGEEKEEKKRRIMVRSSMRWEKVGEWFFRRGFKLLLTNKNRSVNEGNQRKR